MTSSTLAILPSVYYFGTPIALLSTLGPDGAANITPISSVWALGDMYVLGLGIGNQGTQNVLHTEELVINLADAALASSIERIAATTGATDIPSAKQGLYRHESDKWRLGGFTPVPSIHVAPPRVAECPVQLEARLIKVVPLGDGSEAVAAHVRVIACHVHDGLAVPGTNHIDLDRWQPLYYTFRHYFAQGERVGVSFKSEQ